MSLPNLETFQLDLRPNGILVATFNRPEVYNAVNQTVEHETLDLLRAVTLDDSVRVMVITGAGKAFSVGGDINYLEKSAVDPELAAGGAVAHYVPIMRAMIDLEKPIIAAINGYAIGFGLGIALMSDITIMADTAKLMCGQLRINAVPAEAPFLWPLLCGLAKAKYYVLTSEFIEAREAERIGLVSLVVPADQVMEKAMATANLLASRGRTAVGWTKRAMNHWLRLGEPILDTALALEALSFLLPDMQKGLQSMKKTIS